MSSIRRLQSGTPPAPSAPPGSARQRHADAGERVVVLERAEVGDQHSTSRWRARGPSQPARGPRRRGRAAGRRAPAVSRSRTRSPPPAGSRQRRPADRAPASSGSRRPRRAPRGGCARAHRRRCLRLALALRALVRAAPFAGDREALAAALPGSVLLQIGQRSRKRLWRQKVGIAPVGYTRSGALVQRLAFRGADTWPDVLRRTLRALVRVGVTGQTTSSGGPPSSAANAGEPSAPSAPARRAAR